MGPFMNIDELIHRNETILSLPEVCLRIQMLAEDPDADLEDFAAVVSQDPAFTAQLLKRVNSAYYGFPARVSTVSRAIGLIGIRELRTLSLAMSAVEVFKGQPMHGYDMLVFWRHAVFTALLGRELARRAGVLHAERLFIAGLLHDIGHLVLFSQLPEAAAGLNRAVLEHDDHLCELERAQLGWDHAELGGALLRFWRLPEELCLAVEHHHAPLSVTGAARETALVSLANSITHAIERQATVTDNDVYDPYTHFIDIDKAVAASVFTTLAAIPEAVWVQAGVGESVIPECAREASGQFDDLLQTLYGV